MNEGQLSPEALRGWVANRFYYQRNIPIKDAAILANCPVREVRRAWIHRILDHDGVSSGAVESAVLSGESSYCSFRVKLWRLKFQSRQTRFSEAPGFA